MAADWDMLWEYALPRERNVSARIPALCGDQLVAVFTYARKSFYRSAVIAFSQADGSELWRQHIDHVAGHPVAGADGTVYVPSFAGAVHAYGPDGALLWVSTLGKANLGPLVLHGDRLVIAETGGSGRQTWCLDASTGAIVWSFDNGGHSYRPTVDNGRVFHPTVTSGPQFGQSSITLHALALDSGTPIWSLPVQQYHFASISVDAMLLVGARNSLALHDCADGMLKAQLDIPTGTAITAGPVAMAGNYVMADDSGTIRAVALERKGMISKKPVLTALWSHSLPDAIAGEPLVHNGEVFVLGEKGEVHRLDPSGQQVGAILVIDNNSQKSGGLCTVHNAIAVAQGRTLGLYRPS